MSYPGVRVGMSWGSSHFPQPQNGQDESKFICLASVKYLIWNFHTLGSKSLYIEIYVLTIPQFFLRANIIYKFDARGLLLIQKINFGFGG